MEAQNWRLNMFFAKSSQQSNAIAQRWALQKKWLVGPKIGWMFFFDILSVSNRLIRCILIVPNMSSENSILDQAAPGHVKVWSGIGDAKPFRSFLHFRTRGLGSKMKPQGP